MHKLDAHIMPTDRAPLQTCFYLSPKVAAIAGHPMILSICSTSWLPTWYHRGIASRAIAIIHAGSKIIALWIRLCWHSVHGVRPD
ncbi:hypothetical protein K503DRAFT_71594 [Rhizopogon vinicolor AM-OR11-026]|uniref:Uncharacterized protein n=1 Tax=Rhizopogon vinicolor AM-OR11-026 TaxID=1314800 RepID=A0A1B7N457_9AGAM|nr:hypothetical protein K503DRAFT_71594 [Rhizopogon vinicolor AM-OR11-026]